MLDQGLGNWEIMLLHQLFQDFVLGLPGLLLLLGSLQVFQDFLTHFLEIRDACCFARDFLREVIIHFGKLLFFYTLNFDDVIVGLTFQFFVRIIRGILSPEFLGFAGFRAAQVFGEAFEGLLGADVAHDVVGFDRLAFAHRSAVQFHQHKIPIFGWPVLDRNESRRAFTHFFDRFVYLRFAGLDRIDLHFQVLVLAQLKFGKNLKNRPEFQRLALFEFDLIDLGTRDRRQLLFVESLLQIFGNQRLQDFALNVRSELAADDRHRRLAGAESGNARHAGDIARRFFAGLGDVGRGNFQFDFALASRFSHRNLSESASAGKAELQLGLVCLSLVHVTRRKRQGNAGGLTRVNIKYKQCVFWRQRGCDGAAKYARFKKRTWCGRRDSNPYGLSPTSS